MVSLVLLAATAFAAGLMNSVAGGGSFLTFPALVFTGVPPVIANASSTVALFPGAFAAAWGFRRDFRPVEGVSLKGLLAVSMAGGITGAILLLAAPARAFDAAMPWLLLLATLLFAGGPHIVPRLLRLVRIGPAALLTIQFLVAVYGGYFGGAVGILMLAVLGLFGQTELNAMNATKTLLNGTMNAVAVVCFILAGKVWWGITLAMLVAAVTGGYLGAHYGRRLDQRLLRWVITMIAVAMTVAFFVRA